MDDDDGSIVGSDNTQTFRKFVQEHMKSFLKPIAEHVEDVKGELADFRAQTKAMQNALLDRIAHDEVTLGKVKEQLGNLGADSEKELGNLAHDLGAITRRVVTLENASQATSAGLQELDVKTDKLSGCVEALRQELENSNSNVHRLQLKHWETQGLAQKLESALAELKDQHIALSERHTSCTRSLAQTQRGADAQRLATSALHTKLEAMDKKVLEEVESLRNKLMAMERSLNKVKDVQVEQSKEVLPMAGELKRLANTVHRLEDEVSGAIQDGDGRQSSQHQPRAIAEMEAAIQEVKQLAANGGDKKFQDMVHALVQRVKKISDELAEVVPTVRSNTSSVSMHTDSINDLEQRVKDAENRGAHTQDRVTRVEGDLSNWSSTLSDLQVKVLTQGTELEKTQTTQARMLKDIGEGQVTMKSLDANLRAAEQNSMSISNRVDVTYEFLHGMGKGLQDTHRSVVSGQDGLLAPKPTTVKGALPNLTVPQPRNGARLTEFARPNTSPMTARSKMTG